jgi:hypothetical protein
LEIPRSSFRPWSSVLASIEFSLGVVAGSSGEPGGRTLRALLGVHSLSPVSMQTNIPAFHAITTEKLLRLVAR